MMDDHANNRSANEPTDARRDADEAALPPPVVLGPLEVKESAPAEETPQPQPLPYRPRHLPENDPTSRELLLGWCMWLLASWILLGMGFQRTPIREMIFASMIGMMFLWPAFRLSQDGRRKRMRLIVGGAAGPAHTGHDHDVAAHVEATHRPALTPGLILRDWFALNSVFQAVIWPHVLTEQWHLDQAAWVSAACAAWTLLAGGIIALGCQSLRNGGRIAAMAAIVLIVFGEPVVLAWMNRLGEEGRLQGFDWPMHVSPIEAIFALTTTPVNFEPQPWIVPLVCVTLAALMIWIALAFVPRRR